MARIPVVSVICSLQKDKLNILLLKKTQYQNRWTLPVSFTHILEDLPINRVQFHAFRLQNGSLAHFGMINSTKTFSAIDAKQVEWHYLYRLPDLSREHTHMIIEGLRFAQKHCNNLKFLKPLLPKTFSLAKLQAAYESFMGPTHTQKFRKESIPLLKRTRNGFQLE